MIEKYIYICIYDKSFIYTGYPKRGNGITLILSVVWSVMFDLLILFIILNQRKSYVTVISYEFLHTYFFIYF